MMIISLPQIRRQRKLPRTSEVYTYIMKYLTVSFHDFKSQNFKLSVSNPKSKYVVYLSVLSQISNCQGLGHKSKHQILKTDRILRTSEVFLFLRVMAIFWVVIISNVARRCGTCCAAARSSSGCWWWRALRDSSTPSCTRFKCTRSFWYYCLMFVRTSKNKHILRKGVTSTKKSTYIRSTYKREC